MYQALYRKYRPWHFKDVSGQKAIVKTLQNALLTNKMSHAYLFAGPRGTGKTTVAKILARTINCLSPKNGESCDECDNCKQSSLKECVDIIEIDAASNNGVDEIRELKNKINLVPSALKYKIYIIDEVHMLSIGAFNALLKTLEEPPSHVIFILATTDVHKVPITIISRCQCFFFKKISEQDVTDKLRYICERENISIQPEVLKEIAVICDGGMRDAIGNLDKLNSYSTGTVTIDDFQELNGIISNETLEQFMCDILNGNIKNVLSTIQTFDKNGKDFVQIANQFLRYVRKQIIDYYVEQKKLSYLEKDVLSLIKVLNEILFKIKNVENTKILFEIELIDFIQSRKQIISREIISEAKTEEKIENTLKLEETNEIKPIEKVLTETEIKKEIIQNNNKLSQKIIDIRINNALAKASKEILIDIKSKWSVLNEYIFDQKIGYLICDILDGTLRVASDENLIISYEYESMVEKSMLHYNELVEQLSNLLNIHSNLVFITDNQWEEIRKEFIKKKEQNIPYIYIKEPEIVDEQDENAKIELTIKNNDSYQTAVSMFGNIVEIE